MGNVLVVDDDGNNRLLLRTLLESAGHAVREAADGGAALSAAADEPPDLVIVDLSLPDMPGVDLIRRLKRDPRFTDIPIALYTATHRGAAVEELVQTYGLSGVIPKPGTAQEILAAIDGALLFG